MSATAQGPGLDPPGVLAALGLDEPARRSHPVELERSMTSTAAFVVVAGECLDHWRSNEADLRLTRAAPHLHQTRVGLRRLRSAVSLFRRSLDPSVAQAARRAAIDRHFHGLTRFQASGCGSAAPGR